MEKENLQKIRHSLAHIMAKAVKEIYPEATLGIGPAIDNGFYYDFDKVKITTEDLPAIEKKMRHLIKQNLSFEKEEVTKKEALDIFKKDPYKIQIINEVPGEKITLYKTGAFVDVCEGPHVENTKEIDPKSFTLDRVAGAYFKGSEDNPMLQRVYGLAFENKEALDKYLVNRQEAEKRDHRKIGKALGLFMFDDEVGQGLPLYLPKGGMLRHLLMNFAMETYLKNGYEIISTPHIAREELWNKSGHLKFYHEDMYGPLSVDDKNYRLKPMNCPFHVKMYCAEKKSYRDLPVKWAEMGTVYRYEKSGELHGLTRPRAFTQDDAHIICTENQLQEEITKALEITRYIYKTLDFQNLIFKLSVRDPENKDKYFGDNKSWQQAEENLKEALRIFSPEGYEIDEGGASFYAPKIDIDAVDAMDRRWQLSTIQVDFNLPFRFNMTYIDEKGEEQTPFMIHRALLGSIERFLGVYIEHTKGHFPLWLSPAQVWVVPVSEKTNDYASEVYQQLKDNNIRAYLNLEDDTLGKKIRNSEMQKIPYVLVVGEKEKEGNTLSVRCMGEDQGATPSSDFIKKLKEESIPPHLR